MKTDIHPPYHNVVTVTCSCGHSFQSGSTSPEIHIEVCSNCHPFYTGKSKLVDAAGRVDKFQQRLVETAAKQKARAHAQTKRSRTPKKDKTVKLG